MVAGTTAQLALNLFDFHELRCGGFHAIQIDACDIGATLCFQIVGSVVNDAFDFMQLLSGRLRGLFRIPGIADNLDGYTVENDELFDEEEEDGESFEDFFSDMDSELGDGNDDM